eukprot:c9262_g1_i1.p1 GENE.c9262_g1_i1~~c9262_g1_i1.p1  ORF type:complete len:229 (+),score=36.96 c9262_g1_i1:150-836(+)
MVTVACGVIPNVDLFRDQLQLEKQAKSPGILVDSFLLTSVPGVYAIGDVCAMRYTQHNPGAIRHLSNATTSGRHVARELMIALRAADGPVPKRRGSKLLNPILGSVNEFQDAVMHALRPGTGANPYMPHPTFELNHFGIQGYVTGDKMGPLTDFFLLGTGISKAESVIALWLWESRLVGAFVSNPSNEDKLLLDQATNEQWYIESVPVLRVKTTVKEVLEHIKKAHRV